MVSYVPDLSLVPPGIGETKLLYSVDLFDFASGAYPKAVPPSAAVYQKDANGVIPFYAGSHIAVISTWNVSTGADLLHAYHGPYVAGSDKLTEEQAKWALGEISWKATDYAYDHVIQTDNGGFASHVDGVLPTLPSNNVRIRGVIYTVIGCQFSFPEAQMVIHSTMGPGEFDDERWTYRDVVIILAGAPNLLAAGIQVGDLVEWI